MYTKQEVETAISILRLYHENETKLEKNLELMTEISRCIDIVKWHNSIFSKELLYLHTFIMEPVKKERRRIQVRNAKRTFDAKLKKAKLEHIDTDEEVNERRKKYLDAADRKKEYDKQYRKDHRSQCNTNRRRAYVKKKSSWS